MAHLQGRWAIFYENMKYIQLLITFCLIFPSTLLAADGGYVAQLQQEAERKQLWQKKEWLNLLHYRQVDKSGEHFESAVDDRSFFISTDGENDPKRELEATLAAFFKVTADDNKQPLCRFVARFHWLSSQLNIRAESLPPVDCKDYKEWRGQVQSEKVTLVFPAYHLNSPSSMFGHTLLRLDPKEGENWSDWLSFAVNFGANVNNSDNSMVYAYKGLMGGYPGQFIVTPYYKKILEYSRIERRDIWEYELNLTPEEVERLVKHLWELKEVNFDYFFFTENCSFRLLELLEVARPEVELTDDFVVTAIPVDTVRAVEQAGMIGPIDYRPSREAILQQMIGSLGEDERVLLSQLVESPSFADNAAFTRLAAGRQRLLVETAYKLVRFRQNKQARSKLEAKKSYQLLSAINRYPVGDKRHVPRPVQPEKSHHSKQWSFKVGERDDKRYSEIGFRMSFHSLEDNELGFLRGAQINIASIKFRRSEAGSFFLQQVDFADIFSLTARTEFFDPLSWRVRGGLERDYRNGRDRLVSHISGGAGYAWNLTADGIGYTLLTGRLEANSEFNNHIEPALGAATGLLLHSHIGTGRLELSGEKFTGGSGSARLEYEQNLVLSRDQAIRVSLKREWFPHEEFSELGISYQLHF
jgi:hypothetical protein